jgi:serine/threonine protein kinase/sugar lactone lactonase YvrE
MASGRRIGSYEVVRELGSGGMGVVYLVHQPALGRPVALKQLWRRFAGDPEFVARFLDESRLTGSLAHPNIVTVFDFFEEDGSPFIAMEYIPRGSLRPHVGQLTLAQIAGVAEGVLAGLAHAHAHSIVHRDLKPENVMLTDDGRVKITDFGIAKATEGGDRKFETATGVTVGTPTYMSPEQAMGREIGPWTDLYSFGIMLYEQVVGQAPFHDSTTSTAILLRHVSERIPPAKEVDPTVDPALSDWIDALLVKDPAERTRSATAAWENLEDIVVHLLGPMWRRHARLPAAHEATATPAPLTPAPFELEGSAETGFAGVTPPPARAWEGAGGAPPTSMTPRLSADAEGAPPTSSTRPFADVEDAGGAPPTSSTPRPLADVEEAGGAPPTSLTPRPLADVEDARGSSPPPVTPRRLVDVEDDEDAEDEGAPIAGAAPTSYTQRPVEDPPATRIVPADSAPPGPERYESEQAEVVNRPHDRPRPYRPPPPPPPQAGPPAPPEPPPDLPPSSTPSPPAISASSGPSRRLILTVVGILIALSVIVAIAASGGSPDSSSTSSAPESPGASTPSGGSESSGGSQVSRAPTVAAPIDVGSAPHAITVGDSGVWVTNGSDGRITRIDPSANKETGHTDVGKAASGVAVAGDQVFVSNKTDKTVTLVRSSDVSITQHVTLIHPANNIAAGGDSLWVTSADANKLIRIDSSLHATEIAVGLHPVGVAVSSDAVWVANRGSNSVTRLDFDGHVVKVITGVGPKPIGVAVNDAGVWVTTFANNKVTRINPDNNSVQGTIDVGSGPQGIAADSSYVWVANSSGTDISQIDLAHSNRVRHIPVGPKPLNVASDGKHAWVTTNEGVVRVTPHG